MARVRIQHQDFDLGHEIARLRERDLRVGAVCSFVGTVRDTRAITGAADDEIRTMELEHYPGMTEKAIEAMIDEAHHRFDFYEGGAPHRQTAACRSDRAGGGDFGAPGREFQGLRVHHGLPQDPGALLEKRGNPSRCPMGRCQGQ